MASTSRPSSATRTVWARSTSSPIRPRRALGAPANEPKVHVTGINRGHIRGSFLIAACADVDGERKAIGSEAVMSRWHVEGCANRETHLLASASFPLHGLEAERLGEDAMQVEVRTRDGCSAAERAA